ncbi:MAG: DNA-binding protein [Prevotella sp.]|nr:DNA-binding protein [Prevotella sp.]
MSQKVQKYKNTNELSKMFGKYYVRAVYDKKFITTAELADYIQMQASVKRSDCKAVLDELGAAMKHYFELGQKIKIDGIGIFKVGLTSAASDTEEGCTAANVKKSRVLFAPETSSTPTGETATVQRPALVNGVPTVVDYEVTTYNHPATMLKDVRFELAQNATGSGFDEESGGGSDSGSGGDDEPRP